MTFGRILLLCCACLGSPVWAAGQAEWNYLYRLSGHGHSAYILGGAHAGLPALGSQISACVQKLADQATVLVLEGNDAEIVAGGAEIQKTLPTLAMAMTSLSESQQAVLRKYVLLKPDLVSVMVADQILLVAATGRFYGAASTLASGTDFPLLAGAIRATKPIGALESLADQADAFRNVSLDVWREALAQHLEFLAESAKAEEHAAARKAMMLAVMQGDEQEILRMRALVETAWELQMVDERNPFLTRRIDQILAKQGKVNVFFAMGGAHLPGDAGVIARLRERGYTLKQVCQ